MTTERHIDFREFPSRAELAADLAARTADALRSEIADGGAATLAVSGGTTPKLFFQELSKAELDWESVTITLVDERWVPETEERSNARLVKQNLLQNNAAAATFVPLVTDAGSPEGGLPEVQERVADLSGPLTVAIIGLGSDGHTASFFPEGDRLEDAIDPTGKALVVPMRAPAAPEPRITLTLPTLVAAGMLVLHIEGDDKKRVLDKALRGEDALEMPIRAVIAHSPRPLEVVWAK
ncbi:6-phosphogluconolactonase [Methylopila turkensis]|uniref:6-phosphogluconolactonase n=1 Tax=Methylopila turkensis TaxID=1437816 RepID=A0A9W6JR93_9HYPH|nr:6-phosphogluconolactonase [Methylopila turkensis]GLK80570.1 6-phosphogluconolactonase [Methylopila turkensis]